MRSNRLFFVCFAVIAAGSALAQPVISPNGVVNASGYQATLAPDTVFVIFGKGLGPATLAAAAAPNYPDSVGGTSITFTPAAGGSAVSAKMVYSVAAQVAGLLPSSIAPGTYAVQLSYQNQMSNSVNVTVAARSFGIATSNSAGTGAAQATIGNVNGGISLVRLTGGSVSFNGHDWTLAPAHPGDELVLWGTGGGADPKNDTGGTSGDQTAAGKFSVNVDGTAITPLYAGAASGYPGLWQINFVLPSSIAANCFAYLQVSAGGQLSNGVTIAIAPAGESSCSTAIPAATLSKLDSGSGTVTMAGLDVGQVTGTPGGTVAGVINRYTVSGFLIPYSGPRFGPCVVLNQTYPVGTPEPSAPQATLDAGTLTITGPGGLNQTVAKLAQPLGPVYNSSIPIVEGGTYTLKASGGSDVGPFSISTTLPNSFSVSNLSSFATINRANPLTVKWSGSGFDQVNILILSTVLTATAVQGASVACTLPASLGTFTIPSAALAYLPASTLGSFQVLAEKNGGGIQSAESTTDPNTVIPLVSGGLVDFGGFSFYIDSYQAATIE
ncbi:MAG TPA: hypothetical protein VFW44_11525 [Bryobacteraceae bacterium]|nr:hypothetical protein [Bryobacteraceae bacterium]